MIGSLIRPCERDPGEVVVMVTRAGRRSGVGGTTDTDQAFSHDEQTAGQSVEIVVLDKSAQNIDDRRRPLVLEPEDDHPKMRSEPMLPRIAELDIERHEHSLLILSGCHHDRVCCASQSFVSDRVDVMPRRGKNRYRCCRDVLVELEPHELGRSGRTSCFASHAPYAAAARTPRSSIVG